MGASSGHRRLDRVKRRMLRDMVAENVATIEGLLIARPRRRQARGAWLGWALLAAAGLFLVGTLKPTSAGRSKLQPEEVADATLVAVGERDPAPTAAAGLKAPQVIDPALFRLAVHRIVVDPGHGGNDPGAIARGLREKDITLDIARRLAARLVEDGFDVVLTRHDDETVSLQERVQVANAAKGDLFLSIHVNSIPTPMRRGIETYILGPTNDPHVERLAGTENSGSGYSLADFRRLLEGVLLDVRHDESHRFALQIQRKLFRAVKRENPKLEDRGVKQAPFVVLVGTEMPGVLAEVSCISNDQDARLLRKGDYRQEIAEALARGVRSYAAARGRNATVASNRAGGI